MAPLNTTIAQTAPSSPDETSTPPTRRNLPASPDPRPRPRPLVRYLRAHAEAPEPGRPPHHARRGRPADVDRLLGGRARDAVRLRAAEPRQRVGEPSLLRPGRRAPDHGLHERGARARCGPDPDRSRL